MTCTQTSQLRTSAAAARGERLDPKRSSRLYWHLRCLREEVEGIIEKYVERRDVKTLVDYGCGNMPYRPVFEPHVEKYIGCDLPGNELADEICTAEGALPFDDRSVDLVLSSQVLEHVQDPTSYLREAHRVLKENGLLLLSTHGVWRYHPDPCDYWRWTSAGLRLQIEEAGFRVSDFRGVMGPASTALQLWQDAVAARLNRRLQKAFFWIMQRLIARADRRCPAQTRDADACVYVVIASKQAN